jgi:Spy/CpxP family protein refolding chaperone
MKRRILLITLLVALLPVFVYANPDRRHSPEVLKERIITLRNWELMNALDLKGKRAERVFSILKRFDEERERLILKRRELMERLKEAIDSKRISSERVEGLINEILHTHIAFAELRKKEMDALAEVLTPEEQARYLVFSERFSHQIKRFLEKKRRFPERQND